MILEPVLTKQNYYRRWLAGEFGNRPQSWNTLEELEKSDYVGPVNIRHTIPGSRYMATNVPKSKCHEVFQEWGVPESQFKFNEPTPDYALTIQGEIFQDYRGLCLTYNTNKVTMREAMKNPLFVTGLQSKILLSKYCDPPSYDWIMNLLDLYQDHVIEFSAFNVKTGYLGLNTIIWEVRKY